MKKLLLATLLVLASALPAHATSWDIGFRVTTIHPTNVSVHYTVSCVRGDLLRRVHRQYVARTPLTRSVPPSLSGASECHIRVTVYDIKPWDGPHGDGQHPLVTTWVKT